MQKICLRKLYREQLFVPILLLLQITILRHIVGSQARFVGMLLRMVVRITFIEKIIFLTRNINIGDFCHFFFLGTLVLNSRSD